MKKITFLTIALLFATLFSTAQLLKKNQKILGGSLSFYLGSVHDTSSLNGKSNGSNFNIFIAPSYGKAIKDNVVLGYSVVLGFNTARSVDSSQENKNKGYQTGASVFIEKFYQLGNNFYLAARSDLGINYSQSHYRQFFHGNLATENKTKSYGAAISLTPSIVYAFNKKLLAQFGLNNFISMGYRQDKTESGSPASKINTKRSQFDFSSALNFSQTLSNISLGFRYIFG
jgi:hypothetical protein